MARGPKPLPTAARKKGYTAKGGAEGMVAHTLHWLRWVLLPAVLIAYLVVWGIPTVLYIPALEGAVINDSADTYEVSSHLFWDWFAHSLASLAVGIIAAVASIEAAKFVAPSHKAPARRVISAALFFVALLNGVFIFQKIDHQSLSTTIHAVLFNVSLAVTAACMAFSRSSNQHGDDDA
jgi:hypothetical protein